MICYGPSSTRIPEPTKLQVNGTNFKKRLQIAEIMASLEKAKQYKQGVGTRIKRPLTPVRNRPRISLTDSTFDIKQYRKFTSGQMGAAKAPTGLHH